MKILLVGADIFHADRQDTTRRS